jgi:hypothetical protein
MKEGDRWSGVEVNGPAIYKGCNAVRVEVPDGGVFLTLNGAKSAVWCVNYIKFYGPVQTHPTLPDSHLGIMAEAVTAVSIGGQLGQREEKSTEMGNNGK